MSEYPYSAPAAVLSQGSESELVEAAIGQTSTEHYLQYLSDAGGRDWAPSWHWPAFFVTAGWMLYRKLWVEWLLYTFVVPFVVVLVSVFVGSLLTEAIGVMVQAALFLGLLFVVAPMFANALYARKLKRLLAKAAARSSDKVEQTVWLQKHGGTSIVWLLILLLPVLLGLVAAIALPAYQSYVEAANAAASR